MALSGSRKYRGAALFLSAAVCLAIAAAPAAAAGSPADWMYSPRTISEIDLTLPPESWKTLEEHPEDAYVPGTFAIAETDGLPGTAGAFTTPIEVGVRLKGSALGSFRTLNQKAAFKIKFDSFVAGQTFLGLEKMTLNNMVDDPSMVHEVTAYEAFQALGVPSPHAGFAYLRVNGESFGLHLNIETEDKVALEKEFGPFLSPPQHLYEGENGADVTPERVARFEVDEGKKKEKGDLEALVAAVSSSSPSFSAAVGPLADLTEMTKMWAVEKYAGHWDGYSGRSTENQPNNFYLYSDAAGKFQMLPWGTDQTWGERLDFEGTGGVLFDKCLTDGSCVTGYRQALTEALATLNGLDLDKSVRCTAERLKPWQEFESAEQSLSHPERVPFSAEQIADEVGSTREFVVARPAELASFLGEPAPPSPSAAGSCSPPAEQRPESVAGPVGSPAGSVSLLRLERTRIGKRAVRLRVTAPAAGRITLYGWTGSGKRHADACPPARLDAMAAGTVEVSCALNDAVVRRLGKRWLRLHLKVDFNPSAGAPQRLMHEVTLRRR